MKAVKFFNITMLKDLKKNLKETLYKIQKKTIKTM